MTEHRIWNPETGITDLDTDPGALAAPGMPGIKVVWAEERERLEGGGRLSGFIERMGREWAIETGAIENLYEIERGVSEELIDRGFKDEILVPGSTDKPREYVLRLLRDQKDVFDGVMEFAGSDRTLSVSYLKELHAALLRGQDVTEGVDALGRRVDIPLLKGAWKVRPNHPERGGVTYMYCPPEQVDSEMDRLASMHAGQADRGAPVEVRAAWLHHRFAQIHPFQDGNGRVARAVASLLLAREGLFPLVVTRDDKPAYLAALEKADEGNLRPFVDLVSELQVGQLGKAHSVA